MPIDNAGNTLGAAREITVTSGLQAFSDHIDAFDTNDYYRFSFNSRSSLNVSLNGLSADVNLQVLNGSGGVIQSSTNSGAIAESLNLSLDPGTYYIRVLQANNGADTDYSLNFTSQSSLKKTDILWRDYSSGRTAVWFMGGAINTAIASVADLNNVAANWVTEGIADFNGDGNQDILWRDYSSGRNAIWFMGGASNTSILSVSELTTVGTTWRIEGVADFNGDARPDLLWRDYSSGTNGIWFMGGINNTSIASISLLTTVSSNWAVGGVADFNGDGKQDILWRDYASGTNGIWFMGGSNNTSITTIATLTTVATNWRVEGIADFNGDNRPDLLWRDYTSGTNGVWFMGGGSNTSINSISLLSNVASSWQPIVYNKFEQSNQIDLAGNTLGSAFNIGTAAGSGTFSDRVNGADPNDYYQFTLSTASNVNLSLNGLIADANLQLLNSSGTLIQASSNAGTAAESIIRNLDPGTYYIRVFQASGETSYTLNLLTAPPVFSVVTVTSPNGGNSLTAGSSYAITWNDNISENVKIDLYKGGAFYTTIAAATASNGTYGWTLPTNVVGGNDYKIRITSVSNSSVFDESDNPFTITDWFDGNIQDAGLRAIARSSFADNVLSRNEMIAIFTNAEDGNMIDGTELNDLRTLVANTSFIQMPEFVRVLSNKVVNPNAANQFYQGTNLGNLAAGSSAGQMENLINKWFRGSDRPTAPSGYTMSYQKAAGNLFGTDGTFSYQDLKQGYLGDCYFLASLGSIAYKNPAAINNMFIANDDNNDGVIDSYTVRFFGQNYGNVTTGADYVTVDLFLPTNVAYNGYTGQRFAYYDNSTVGLWVALAEKAYAQFAEAGITQRPSTINSYGTIESGWGMQAMPSISGRTANCYSDTNLYGKIGNFPALATIVNDLANGKAMTAGSTSNPGFGITQDHEYIILSASLSDGYITLYNPHGVTASGETNGFRVISYNDFRTNFDTINLV